MSPQVSGFDQHQIMQWSRVRDDNPHASKSEALKVFHVALDIFHAIRFEYVMGLEKAVNLVEYFKSREYDD